MSTNPYQSSVPLVAGEVAGHYTYRSLGWLAVMASIAMLGLSVLYVALAITVYLFEPVIDAAEGEEIVQVTSSLVAVTLGIAGGACLMVLLLPVCALLFSLFVHAANKNARALGAQGMRFTPGWAVGWFFIPLANLYFPWAVMKEIYLASDLNRLPHAWREGKAPLVNAWWGTMIAHLILSLLEDFLPESAAAGQVLGIAAALAFLASAALAAWLLHAICRRQEAAIDGMRKRGAEATPALSTFAERGA